VVVGVLFLKMGAENDESTTREVRGKRKKSTEKKFVLSLLKEGKKKGERSRRRSARGTSRRETLSFRVAEILIPRGQGAWKKKRKRKENISKQLFKELVLRKAPGGKCFVFRGGEGSGAQGLGLGRVQNELNHPTGGGNHRNHLRPIRGVPS